jgi:hypothetical protein
MSALLVRAALEVALAAMSPALATSNENAPYSPVVGTPYQRVTLLLAEPGQSRDGKRPLHRAGLFSRSASYPLDAGPGAATTRAELIRSTFYRGRSFTSGAVTVNIETTPEIAPGRVEEDRFVIPVKVRFYAHILRS